MKQKNSIMQQGQTLITLIFFMVIAVSIVSAAVVMIYLSAKAQSKQQLSEDAYAAAESGAENALLRLLRDPSYTGETMSIDDGSVTTSISGSNPVTITSIGKEGDNTREIHVTAGYTNNVLTVSSWKEVPQ
jgi:hypothetical protein